MQHLPVVYSKLTELQRSDGEYKRILDSVNNQTNKTNFYIKNNILMFKKNDRCTNGKIFLPLSLVEMIFEYYHTCNNFGGHPGYSRT